MVACIVLVNEKQPVTPYLCAGTTNTTHPGEDRLHSDAEEVLPAIACVFRQLFLGLFIAEKYIDVQRPH